MEVEAVHASSWCQEDAALLVKVSTHVHQNLTQEQGKEEGMMRCDLHAIVYRTVGLLSKGFPARSRVLSCPSLIDFRYFADFSKHWVISDSKFSKKAPNVSKKCIPAALWVCEFSVYRISIFPHCQNSNNMCILLAEDFWAQNTWNTAHRSCVGKTDQPFFNVLWNREKLQWRTLFKNSLTYFDLWTVDHPSNSPLVMSRMGFIWTARWLLCNLKAPKQSCTHIIEVDDHGAVAHVRRLVIGLAAGGEGHPAGAGPDRHAQGVTCRLGWRSGVTYDQTFPLKDDGLCVILAPRPRGSPEQKHSQQYGEVEGDWPGIHDWIWDAWSK